MRTFAVLPVKRFGAAKQRLGERLAPPVRAALAEAMVADVLEAATACPAFERTVVVTAEPRAAHLARAAGADVVTDTREAGQSPAAAIGVGNALAAGWERVLLLPGDTPLVTARELEELMARPSVPERGVAIVSDRHGTGTNGLVLSPPDALVPRFGPQSLARHLAAARSASVACGVERVRALEHDVDTPEDLGALVGALEDADAVAARHTRRALARVGLVGARPVAVAEAQP